MPPSIAIKPPSTTEYLNLIQSPKVDIYVGEEKKHFSLPKALLCYYSKYFDRCFNGSFKEAQSQTLELFKDCCDYFEPLLGFMIQGRVSEGFFTDESLMKYPAKLTGDCREFMEYADKFEFGAIASDILYQPLCKAWNISGNRMGGVYGIMEQDIEVFYGIAPLDHPLMDLVVRVALWVQVDEKSELDMSLRRFKKQEKEIEGFASSLLDDLIRVRQGSLVVDLGQIMDNGHLMPLDG